ncbi:hypothetical protein SDC9_161913 [bioreactor metagenome]|uniref:Uncharacterized protein n=1 Tax=bioreactor metagenome TaxID=1076179 RepID=A0A645FLN8_9ZZZZ
MPPGCPGYPFVQHALVDLTLGKGRRGHAAHQPLIRLDENIRPAGFQPGAYLEIVGQGGKLKREARRFPVGVPGVSCSGV